MGSKRRLFRPCSFDPRLVLPRPLCPRWHSCSALRICCHFSLFDQPSHWLWKGFLFFSFKLFSSTLLYQKKKNFFSLAGKDSWRRGCRSYRGWSQRRARAKRQKKKKEKVCLIVCFTLSLKNSSFFKNRLSIIQAQQEKDEHPRSRKTAIFLSIHSDDWYLPPSLPRHVHSWLLHPWIHLLLPSPSCGRQ